MESMDIVVKTEFDDSSVSGSDNHNYIDTIIAKSELVGEDEINNEFTKPIAIKQEVHESDDDASELKTEMILLETKIEHDEPMVNIPKKRSQNQKRGAPKKNSDLNSNDANISDERYKCLKCTLIFLSYADLLRHSIEHEQVKNLRLYHCGYEQCFHVSKTSNLLLRHIEIKHGTCRKPFACGICRQKFETVADFELHRDSLHQNPWLCNICDALFSDIAEHYRTKHGDNVKPKKQTNLPTFTPYERVNLQTKDATYICQICSIDFALLPEAKYHVNHDHPSLKKRSCEKCGRAFSRRTDMIRHMKSGRSCESRTCEKCGRTFGRRSDMLRHAETSSSCGSRSCEKCGRTFGRRTEMLRHVKTSTSCGNPSLKRRNFVCKFCSKAFRTLVDLNRHSALHADEDPDFKGHICKLCGKAFTLLAEYEFHVNRHKRLKPYKCSTCGKGFADLSTRNRHERTDACPNQMVLCCVVCDEEFSGVMMLAAHICPGKKDD